MGLGHPGDIFQCIYSGLALPLTSALAARDCTVLCSNPLPQLCHPRERLIHRCLRDHTAGIGCFSASCHRPMHFGLSPSPWQHPWLSPLCLELIFPFTCQQCNSYPHAPHLVLSFTLPLPSPLFLLLSCFPQHAAHHSKEMPNKGADVILVAHQLLQVFPGLQYYSCCDFFFLIPLLTLLAFVELLSLTGEALGLCLKAPCIRKERVRIYCGASPPSLFFPFLVPTPVLYCI